MIAYCDFEKRLSVDCSGNTMTDVQRFQNYLSGKYDNVYKSKMRQKRSKSVSNFKNMSFKEWLKYLDKINGREE